MVRLEEKILLVVIVFFAALSLISLLNYKLVWWDEAVYIGIGKYLYTGGSIGLFEKIRPLMLPIFLGFLWVLNLDPLLFGRLLVLFSSLLNLYLIYLIGRKIFDSKVAVFASLLLAFTLFYYSYSYLLLTGILSTTFALISVYFFIQERNFRNIAISSFFLGVAFLTRFPQGILLIGFLIFLLYKREFKNVALLFAVFLLTITPYLIFNLFKYGSIFTPFFKASEVITEYSWLYSHTPLFYIKELFFQNYLFIFIIPFLFYFYRERKGTLILLILIIFFSFFTTSVHKELRYSLIFIPYLALLSSRGFFWLKDSLRLDDKTKKIITLLAFIILLLNFSTNMHFASGSYPEEEVKFYSDLKEGETIHSTTPIVAYFSNAKIIPIYTTLDKAEIFIKKEKPSKLFFLDTFPCNTQECKDRKKELISWMKENYYSYNYYEPEEAYFFTNINNEEEKSK